MAQRPELRGFAEWLRSRMAARRVSNRALARAVHVDQATVSQWRSGVFPPSDDKLPALANALGVPLPELRRIVLEAKSLTTVPHGSLIHAAMLGGPDAAAQLREERLWLSKFQFDLVSLDAPEEMVSAFETLVARPEVRTAYDALKGETTVHASVRAMEWLGGFLRREAAAKGGHETRVVEGVDPKRDRQVSAEELSTVRRLAKTAAPSSQKKQGQGHSRRRRSP